MAHTVAAEATVRVAFRIQERVEEPAAIVRGCVVTGSPAQTMTELLEAFDEFGESLGLVRRDVVHRNGLWHRAANVFLFRTDGRLVVQRRQSTKDVCPGIWDLSVAEHLKPGENHLSAAKRGLKEELGIEGASLDPVGGVAMERLEIAELGIKDYELQQSFRTVSDGELTPDSDEVAELRLLRLDELERLMRESPDDFTPWFRHRARDLPIAP
jgi:isopentenyl-diphosphate delta-isomerase